MANDPAAKVLETFGEPADDVEDKGALSDMLAKVTESIRHSMHTAAVVRDREATLDEGSKFSVKV